jgi:hypothetical protein
MEIQYLVAYVCYNSPTVVQRGESLNESEFAKALCDQFYGAKDDDPETICYLEQFINGLHKFKGLFVSSEDPDEHGRIILTTMPQKLHRYGGVHLFVGPGSVTKEIMSQTNFTNATRISGAL